MNIIKKRNNYHNDIEGVHFINLEILKCFVEICKKNKIEYWITDGTLLGAIRHKGFIPWDDDIDVCVKKSDIKRLGEVLKKELPYYLFLTNDNILKTMDKLSFYKIRDKYSTLREKEVEERNTGIWIDIFPMNEISENRLLSRLINKIPGEKSTLEEKMLKKVVRRIIWQFLSILGFKKLCELRSFFYKIESKKEKNSYIYMEGESWWHTYRKEWIFPLKEIEFEGFKFSCPNNPEKYLESYYGKDYMQLPPENKRVTHGIEIDLFNSNNSPESLKWSDREEHLKIYGQQGVNCDK